MANQTLVSGPGSARAVSVNGTNLFLRINTAVNYDRDTNTASQASPNRVNIPGAPAGVTSIIYYEVPNDQRGNEIFNTAKNSNSNNVILDPDDGKRYVAIAFAYAKGSNTVRLGPADVGSNAKWVSDTIIRDMANYNNGRTDAPFSSWSLRYSEETALRYIREQDDDVPGLGDIEGTTGFTRSPNSWRQVPEDDRENQQQDIQLGTVSKEDFDIGSEVIGIDKKQKAFDGKTLRYPTQIMADKGTDYLMIEIQQYVRNKSTENKLVRANTNDKLNDKASEITKIGSIILPIPSSIQDGNSVSYADGTLDSLSAAALQGVSNTIKDFNLMSGQTSQELTRQFTSNLGSTFSGMMDAGLKGQFIRTLASQAVSSIPGVSAITPDQFLARQTGGIMNPNMELLFNGVTLRSFKFSFKMTPRDKDEGKEIKQIIRNLKINMAPQTLEVGTSKKNNFIRTPNVFKLSYMQGSSPHPFLHKFKICALTDMAVNYTGEGLYATYSDATPISIILDLTFKELEPIYDTDYFENDGTLAVGY